jgi:hypothetical protein
VVIIGPVTRQIDKVRSHTYTAAGGRLSFPSPDAAIARHIRLAQELTVFALIRRDIALRHGEFRDTLTIEPCKVAVYWVTPFITTSVTAYRGSPHLLDYAATKGADRRLHPLAGQGAGGAWHPRQRGSPGTDLDAFDPLDLSRGAGGRLRGRRADAAGGAAGRGRPELRLFGLG